jgi:hypothetical protein
VSVWVAVGYLFRFKNCFVFDWIPLTGRHVGIIEDLERNVMEDGLELSSFYLFIQIFLGVSAAIVIIGGFMRWADRQLEARIVKEIKDSTYQIQPNTNGGASLSDLHKKIDGLITDVAILKSSILRLEGELRSLEEDVEDLR